MAKSVLDRLSGAGVSGLSVCRTASGLLFLSWTEGQVQGSLGCWHAGQFIRVVNSVLGRLSGEGTLGCRYVGQHQGCCLCPRQKVRCRGLWAVGVQDSIRVAKFVLDRLSGAGVSGLSACRTASGLLFLSWTEAQVQGSLDCRHTGQHQGCRVGIWDCLC